MKPRTKLKIKHPKKAQCLELFGVSKRVRLAVYSRCATVAMKCIGSVKLGFSPCWEVLAKGPIDDMRDLAERLGPQIDRYASAAGVRFSQVEAEE